MRDLVTGDGIMRGCMKLDWEQKRYMLNGGSENVDDSD